MSRNEAFEGGQILALLLASLLTDCFLQPFGLQAEALPARTAILAGALRFGALFLAALAFSRLCPSGAPKGAARLALTGALVLSIALETIQAERFYNYVMRQQLAALPFLLLVLAAVWYGAFCGLPALGRAAAVLLALTAASVAVLAWSVAGQLDFRDLQTPAIDAPGLWRAVQNGAYLPPELVLLPLAGRDRGGRGAALLTGTAFLTDCLLAVLGEMTLGAAYTAQAQPVYTVARLGGLSVFRRLDALHVGVWLLLFLLKTSLYFAAVLRVWQGEAGGEGQKSRQIFCWALGAVFIVFLAVWNQREGLAFAAQQALLVLAALLALIGRAGRGRPT